MLIFAMKILQLGTQIMTGALLYHSLQVSLAKWIKHETFAYLSQKEFKPRKKQILIIFKA